MLGKTAKERTCEIGSESLVEGMKGGRAALKNHICTHKQKCPHSEIKGLVSLAKVLRTFLFNFESGDAV